MRMNCLQSSSNCPLYRLKRLIRGMYSSNIAASASELPLTAASSNERNSLFVILATLLHHLLTQPLDGKRTLVIYMLHRAVQLRRNLYRRKLLHEKHLQYASAHQRQFPKCVCQTALHELEAIRNGHSLFQCILFTGYQLNFRRFKRYGLGLPALFSQVIDLRISRGLGDPNCEPAAQFIIFCLLG